MTIHVNTIERVFGRRLEAVAREEGCEVVQPFRSHRNAPPAPVLVADLVHVVATSLGVLPRAVLRSVLATVAVIATRVTNRLLPTAARGCMAAAKITAAYIDKVTAVTQAPPAELSISALGGLFDHGQFSVTKVG